MLNAWQDWRTSIYQSYCVFAPLFSKKNSATQDIASTEIAYQFLAPRVPVLSRNKAINRGTSTDPFLAATKTLVLGNLFKLVRSAKWEEYTAIVIFSGGGSRIFFRRRCTRLFSTSTPINHIFLENTSCIRKPQVISGGGWAPPEPSP